MDRNEVWTPEVYLSESDRYYITIIIPLDTNTYIGTDRDITELKNIEKALKEGKNIYRAIGESIDYGVWVCDPDGRNTYASPSFLKMIGLTQQQCSDFGWGDSTSTMPNAPSQRGRSVSGPKAAGISSIASTVWTTNDINILAHGVPVRDDAGKIACWAGINLDISDIAKT